MEAGHRICSGLGAMADIYIMSPERSCCAQRLQTQNHRGAAGFGWLVGLLALFAAAKPILYDTMDPDAFWHLRVAEQLQHDGIGPLVDRISFASQAQPWTPYSWLAEMGMKWVWDLGGFRAAILMQSIVMGSFITLLAIACAIGAVSKMPLARATPWDADAPTTPHARLGALAAAVFGAYLALPCLSFRPVTFVLVVLAICLVLLVRDRRDGEKSRAVWLIVPLATLGANMHFYAFLLPAWVGLLWIGSLFEANQSSDADRNLLNHHAGRYARLWIASLIACCLTPMFAGSIAAMVHYQFFDPMVRSGIIAEMQPFTAGMAGKITLLMVIATSVIIARQWRTVRMGERLLAVLGVVLLCRLGRFAPIYALLTCPVLAATMPRLSDRILQRPGLRGMVAGVIAAGIVRIALVFPPAHVPFNQWLNRHTPEAGGYPTEAADYVAQNIPRLSGRLINEFSWGGYLGWRLGDQYQVLLDGRTQVFSRALWQNTYLGDERQRRNLLSAVDADAAVLPVGKSRFRATLVSLGWVIAHHDAIAEVWAPPTLPVANVHD